MLSRFWGETIDTLAAIHFTCVIKRIKFKNNALQEYKIIMSVM